MNRSGSGGGMSAILIVVGLAFVLGAVFSTALGVIALSPQSFWLLVIFGGVLLFIGAVVMTITRLYVKTSADQAFVRTGMGGQQPIIDGGALVVPVVHEVVPVSLQTMRLDVDRAGPDALITGDNLRADVAAEFYIKVQKIREHILAAATSLGERSVDAESVKHLVNQKLVSALRTVAATRPLHELHTKRDEFAKYVQVIVEQDLAHNGLTLESVTISRLDQTPPNAMRGEDNVFDAQGLRTIAEITQRQRVERNQIQREADQKVTAQDVTRDQFVFEQEVARANAEAEKDRNIQISQARARQEADTVAAEQTRLAGLAAVKRDEAIQVAEVEKNRALEVANQMREQAARVAEIEKLRTAELATRTSEIEIATRERDRADAEAARFAAEAKMEEQRQAVRTVEVTQTAERDKARAVIEAQAEFERRRLNEQVQADVAAYAVVKAAEGAEAAAEKDASAQLTRAKAERDSMTLRAEGERATQLVPVDVERTRVEVERARVEVERAELENKAQFESISRDLQVDLARIDAERAVRIAAADAYGRAMANAKMTVWGDPSTMARMADTFFQGQQLGALLEGAFESTPDSVKQAIGRVGNELLGGAGNKNNGGNSSNGNGASDQTVAAEAAKRPTS